MIVLLLKAQENLRSKMIKLPSKEKKILSGDAGQLQKNMLEAIVLWGDFFGAKELVPITGCGHVVLGFGNNGFEVATHILDDLIAQGARAKFDFTIGTWPYAARQTKLKWLFEHNSAFKKQQMIEQKLFLLGLNQTKPYMDVLSLAKSQSVKYGDVLCWSDPMLVTFANSVFGARVNCSGPLLDLFCNILGKVPYYGLLTEEGRKAQINIKVDVQKLPDAGLLGVAVAQKCGGKVPYIYGLEKLLRAKYDEQTLAFLKDFSAGFSSEGSCRIFHINGITPEARQYKKDLVVQNSQTITIDEQEIEKVKANFELAWSNLDARPSLCYIGWPDLSLYQLVNWTNEIGWELKQNRRNKLKIKTVFFTNNAVLEQFKKLPEFEELRSYGGVIKTNSPLSILLSKRRLTKKIITNSNQIRQNANVKFCKEEEILNLITGKKRNKHG